MPFTPGGRDKSTNGEESMNRKAKEFVQDGYDITITGRNVLVTDAMKDYAMEKISKVDRITNRVMDVSVIMDIQKLEHRVEIIIRVNNTKVISSAATTDMYVSVDQAVNKLKEQLRRYKTRLQNHQSKGHEEVAMLVNVYAAPKEIDVASVNEEIEEENNRINRNNLTLPSIVKQESSILKILNNEEAIMKMELSGDQFMIFRGEEDRKIKVIYRRKDGNYGIIQTES